MTFTWINSYLLEMKPFFIVTLTLLCLMTHDYHASSIALVSCKDMKTNVSVVVEQARDASCEVIGSPTEITLLGKVSATLTIPVPVIHVTSTILLVLRC